MRDMRDMQPLLSELSARHAHLCPRQILGLRIGLAGAARLGLALPRTDKTLLVIAESDGCFADGLEVAAGVSIGHRTLRVEDYGKVAATFVNAQTGAALRLAPRPDIRRAAFAYAPGETRRRPTRPANGARIRVFAWRALATARLGWSSRNWARATTPRTESCLDAWAKVEKTGKPEQGAVKVYDV